MEVGVKIFVKFIFGVEPFLGRAALEQMLFSWDCQRLAKSTPPEQVT